MNLKNKWFYFGKVPPEYIGDHECPEGWEDGYYFRVTLDEGSETIRIEDTCNRYVPLDFANLFEFQQILAKVQGELLSSLIGAPNPNK